MFAVHQLRGLEFRWLGAAGLAGGGGVGERRAFFSMAARMEGFLLGVSSKRERTMCVTETEWGMKNPTSDGCWWTLEVFEKGWEEGCDRF